MNNAKTIGFVGLGVMGEPMCRNLAIKHNGQLLGLDIDLSPLDRLSSDGVKSVCSLAEIAELSEIIILSLPGGNEVNEVCLGKFGLVNYLRSGQIVLDASTSPPSLSRKIYKRFADFNVAFADTPVARTRQAAIEGNLSIMVGADKGLYDLIEPILRFMASDVIHCGEIGSGQVCKILNNMVLFQNIAALSEALLLGKKYGLDGEQIFNAISKSSGDSFALRSHGLKSILPDSFPEGAFSIRYAMKDLSYALDLASEMGVSIKGAERIEELFQAAVDSGWGDFYHPIIKKVIEAEKS